MCTCIFIYMHICICKYKHVHTHYILVYLPMYIHTSTNALEAWAISSARRDNTQLSILSSFRCPWDPALHDEQNAPRYHRTRLNKQWGPWHHVAMSWAPPGAVISKGMSLFLWRWHVHCNAHSVSFFLSLFTRHAGLSHTGSHMSQQKVLRIACACASTYAHAQPRIHTRSHARAHAHTNAHTHACSHTPTPPYIHRNRQRHVHTHRCALKRTCPDTLTIRLHAHYTPFSFARTCRRTQHALIVFRKFTRFFLHPLVPHLTPPPAIRVLLKS